MTSRGRCSAWSRSCFGEGDWGSSGLALCSCDFTSPYTKAVQLDGAALVPLTAAGRLLETDGSAV